MWIRDKSNGTGSNNQVVILENSEDGSNPIV